MACFIDVDPTGQRLKFLVQASGVHMEKLQREVRDLQTGRAERESGIQELTREVMRLLREMADLRRDHETLKHDHEALKQQLAAKDLPSFIFYSGEQAAKESLVPSFDFYPGELLNEQTSSFGSPFRS